MMISPAKARGFKNLCAPKAGTVSKRRKAPGHWPGAVVQEVI
jgi:hypothetical protein